MSDWPIIRLSKLLDIQNGYAFKSKQFSADGEMPLIRIRDINPGTGTVTRYTGEFDEKYVVREGDLLIGMDGDFECHIWNGPDALLNQRVCRLENFSTELLPNFLFYGINKYLKDIHDVTGYTTVKHLSGKSIREIDFPVPPVAEQKRIVAILDEAFAAIDKAMANTENNLANAREILAELVDAAFLDNTEGWTRALLGGIAEFKNGLNFTKSSKGEVVTIVGVKDFKSNYWVPREQLDTVQIDGELPENYRLQKGDIVIVRSNGNKQLIGRCILAGDVPENTSHSGFTIRARLMNESVSARYLAHYLKSDSVRGLLIDAGAGANISSLNQKALSNLAVQYPDMEGQKNIVNRIETLNTRCSDLSDLYIRKLDTLNELRMSLLHQSFTGVI